MDRGGAVLAAVVALAAVVLPMAGPAAANHDVEVDQLSVTIAINAAGDDRISVGGDVIGGSSSVSATPSEVAIALGRPEGSFREVDEYGWYGYVVLDDKLAAADDRGGLSYPIDTGEVQLLAQRSGYEVVLLKVCTPKVRQVVDALKTPEELPWESPASRCRGWYQEVDAPAIRAVLQLAPDRDRYPAAVTRTVGTAAIAFGFLGIGATLLRRGPLRRRSVASWLVASFTVVVVGFVGWGAVTLALWLSGANADPVLLSGGTEGEQIARTLLPGLAFLIPAFLPAAILLSVPRKEKPLLAPPAPRAGPVAQPQAAWWPTAWWGQWAAAEGTPAAAIVPGPLPPSPSPAPGPVPGPRPPMPGPPDPPAAGPPGWAPPL